jgi:hypothetical protein
LYFKIYLVRWKSRRSNIHAIRPSANFCLFCVCCRYSLFTFDYSARLPKTLMAKFNLLDEFSRSCFRHSVLKLVAAVQNLARAKKESTVGHKVLIRAPSGGACSSGRTHKWSHVRPPLYKYKASDVMSSASQPWRQFPPYKSRRRHFLQKLSKIYTHLEFLYIKIPPHTDFPHALVVFINFGVCVRANFITGYIRGGLCLMSRRTDSTA